MFVKGFPINFRGVQNLTAVGRLQEMNIVHICLILNQSIDLQNSVFSSLF